MPAYGKGENVGFQVLFTENDARSTYAIVSKIPAEISLATFI